MTTPSEIPSVLLTYLPPFVHVEEGDTTHFLDRFLRIFEAMLFGRPDSMPLTSWREGKLRTDLPYEEMIDRLPELFDPWQMPDAFLNFVAARLGLTLVDDWDDARKRRLIEKAVSIFQQRWTKRGFYTFIELYAPTGLRPRVAIDDGESLLAGRWTGEKGFDVVDLHPIAFARPGLPRSDAGEHIGVALTHPVAIAVGGHAADREIVVADRGPFDLKNGARQVALWRLNRNGQFMNWTDTIPSVPRPMNEGEPDPKLQTPVAVIADADGSYLVLDQLAGTKANVWRYTATGRVKDPVATLNAFLAVDMLSDHQGRLLVLGHDNLNVPSLVRVTLPIPGIPPVAATVFPLGPTVITPTAMVMESGGTVLISDARALEGGTPEELAGDIVRVTLSPTLMVESLLSSVVNNPLIFPKSLVIAPDGSLLVCDTGLKGRTPGSTVIRILAEPARLFRIDLPSSNVAGSVPSLASVRLGTSLVTPVDLAMDENRVLIVDFGEFHKTNLSEYREWRTKPHRFGVVVDFSKSRPTTNASEIQQFLLALVQIIERERPAHVVWEFQFQPDSGFAGLPDSSPVDMSTPRSSSNQRDIP